MKPYHKIHSLFKRDREKKNVIIPGEHWDGEKVIFGGRTDNAQIPARLIARLQNLFPSEKMHRIYGKDKITLYGEGFGAKIQKGGGLYYMPSTTNVNFILFDVMVGEWILKREDVIAVAGALSLSVVPELAFGSIHDAIEMVRHDNKSRLGKRTFEGLVGRADHELLDRAGNRLICKVKVKDFEQYDRMIQAEADND
jgi:hypothetical protein